MVSYYLVKSLYYLTTKDITKVPGFYFHKASSMKIKFHDTQKRNWCIDGEKLEDESDTYEIKIKRNIKLLIPKKNIEELFTNE